MKNIISKVLYILEKKDKQKFIGVFFIILGSAFFDLVGISALLPVVSLLSTNDPQATIESDTLLTILSNIFQTNKVETLCIASLVCLCIVYLLKTAYAFITSYVINKFTLSFSRRLSIRLMDTFLSMPYEYHLDNNSSTLIRKSTYDVSAFTSSINSILTFIVKVATTITIIVYLFVTDWIIMLIIGSLLTIFAVFIVLILRPHIRKIGYKTQQLNSNNYKYLSQAFNGIKESKISNTEHFFAHEYDKNVKEINRLNVRNSVYRSIPGHSLELVGMVGMAIALIVIILLKKGDTDYSDIITKFAIFVYAVIKLLPCVTEITSTINSFGYYEASINSIYEDIKTAEKLDDIVEEEEDVIAPLPFNDTISVNNVSFFYQGVPDKLVLKNVSCSVKKNTSVAFSGMSGAGKTTLIDIILGLLPPREGNVECDGIDISTNMRGWRTNVSYIPQTIYLMDDTIRKNIAFGVKEQTVSDAKIWDALEKAQLADYVRSLPHGLDTVIGERGIRMSGGQRQRIGIARAFYRNTNIIVFDEATSALDYETEKNILDHVSRVSKDHTLIIITHRLNTIDSCDHIYKLVNGCIESVK